MNLPRKTSSARSIMDAVLGIYDEKVNPKLSVRRITITANKIVSEDDVPQKDEVPVQFNLFDDIAAQEQQRKNEENRLERERKIQEAMLGIKKKFGKNAILNGAADGSAHRARRERDRARRRSAAAPSRAASGEANSVHHLLRAGRTKERRQLPDRHRRGQAY